MGWVFYASDNAPTDGPEITAVAIIMTALALTTVLLRLYVRFGIIRASGIDDWLIIFAWGTSAGFAIITVIQTRYGLGLERIADLPAEDVYAFGLLQYMGAPFYITSILGFKISLLCSYLRFIPSGAYRWATYAVLVLTVLFHLSFLIVQINLCSPIAAQWDPTIKDFTCLPSVPVYTTMASLTMLFDITVMLLPFPVLMHLNMQNRKKVVLLGLFGLGIFITVIQIIRIMTVHRLAVYTDSAPLIMWSAVETNLGIIVACVPCLSPLFKYFKDRTLSASRNNYNNNNNTTTNNNRSGGGKRTTTTASGYAVGSQYALRTWKASSTTTTTTTGVGGGDRGGGTEGGRRMRRGRGEAGVEDEEGNSSGDSMDLGHEASARAGMVDGNESMEYILEPTKIVRRTEVTITRS